MRGFSGGAGATLGAVESKWRTSDVAGKFEFFGVLLARMHPLPTHIFAVARGAASMALCRLRRRRAGHSDEPTPAVSAVAWVLLSSLNHRGTLTAATTPPPCSLARMRRCVVDAQGLCGEGGRRSCVVRTGAPPARLAATPCARPASRLDSIIRSPPRHCRPAGSAVTFWDGAPADEGVWVTGGEDANTAVKIGSSLPPPPLHLAGL